ncbi:MAG: hypothetical protein ACM3OO_05965, partial [Planctomycetaceae bacterium]
ATVIALLAIVGLRPLRRMLQRRARISGELRVEAHRDANVSGLLDPLEASGATLERIRIDGRDGRRALVVAVKLPAQLKGAELTQRVADDPRVDAVDWAED